MANTLAPSIAKLIDEFAKFPTIGKKSAQRLAFHILKKPIEESQGLCSAIMDAKNKVTVCSVCFNYSESPLCEICADPKRDRSLICVVEQPFDIYPFEKVGLCKGLYHVLGGALSPLDGITPDRIRVRELLQRAENGVNEVILATNSSPAGEATSLYITKRLKELKPIKVTRIARGIPMGSELEFMDEVTLHQSFLDRIEVI
jgi:recombination protein RecR